MCHLRLNAISDIRRVCATTRERERCEKSEWCDSQWVHQVRWFDYLFGLFMALYPFFFLASLYFILSLNSLICRESLVRCAAVASVIFVRVDLLSHSIQLNIVWENSTIFRSNMLKHNIGTVILYSWVSYWLHLIVKMHTDTYNLDAR